MLSSVNTLTTFIYAHLAYVHCFIPALKKCIFKKNFPKPGLFKQNDSWHATWKYLNVYGNLNYFIIVFIDIIHLSKYTFWKRFLTYVAIIKIFIESRSIDMLCSSWFFPPWARRNQVCMLINTLQSLTCDYVGCIVSTCQNIKIQYFVTSVQRLFAFLLHFDSSRKIRPQYLFFFFFSVIKLCVQNVFKEIGYVMFIFILIFRAV